jgi:hypothetical protein
LYERFDADQVRAFVKAYVKISADWAVNELGKPNMPPAAEVPYRAASPAGWSWRFEQTPASVTACGDAPAGNGVPHATTFRVTLYADPPYADLELTLHDKPADPWPEAGWMCLPVKAPQPQFRLGRLGSIIDPARDIVPGSNRHLLAINTGLTVTDAAGQGVGICPLDDPLVSLDTPGCWKYSRDFVPPKPDVYVNLFNNQWTTNFRLWNEGTWTSRVRLWAFDRYNAEASLITPSLEARYPLQAAFADGPAGSLPVARNGLELSRKGVLMAAFGENPDGPGRLLRLWESAGQSGPCQVRLPSGLKAKGVRPVDLRGRPAGKPLPVKEGVFTVNLQAFAPFSGLLQTD